GSHTDPSTNETTISLGGAATFIRLPKLAAVLESVPAGAKVNLEIGALRYIDHACLDLIANWRKQHIARDGQAVVPWEDLRMRYREVGNGNHVQPPQVRLPLIKVASGKQ